MNSNVPGAMNYQSPLSIYIVWHHQFGDRKEENTNVPYGGIDYAKCIYSLFCMDLENPVKRGMGIPVFYRFHPFNEDTNCPAEIPFHESRQNAIVVLTEANMASDLAYQTYVNNIVSITGNNMAVFFFALDKYGEKAFPEQHSNSFYRLFNESRGTVHEVFKQKSTQLQSLLLQSVCKLLFSNTQTLVREKRSPLNLHIHYAQKDGAPLAHQFHSLLKGSPHLNSILGLRLVNVDLEDLSGNQHTVDRNTVLMIVQTPEMVQKEWHKNVVYDARSRSAFIMLLYTDKLQDEMADYGHMRGVISGRWQGNFSEITDLIFEQFLKRRFASLVNDTVVERNRLDKTFNCETFGHLPELFELIRLKDSPFDRNGTLVMYPDPPLSPTELNLLKEANSSLHMATPVVSSMFTGKISHEGVDFDSRFLHRKRVCISIASYTELSARGFGEEQLVNTILEFGRYLLAHGGHLVMGQDLRRNGYARHFAALNRYYLPPGAKERRCTNYLAWPEAERVGKTAIFDMEDAGIITQPMECPEAIDSNCIPEPVEYFYTAKPPTALPLLGDWRYRWAVCWREMRCKMIRDSDASILLGGKTSGFKGVIPGLLEEALIAIEEGNPIYIIGGLGGMSSLLAEMIQGSQPEELTPDYQESKSPGTIRGLKDYTQLIAGSADLYKEGLQKLNGLGLEGLSALNGLSTADNLRLFETPHIPEMLRLVLKGMEQKFGSHK